MVGVTNLAHWVLDPRTLVVANGLASLSMGGVALLFAGAGNGSKAIRQYGAGLLVAGAGWALTAVRGVLPDLLTFPLATWLGMASMVLVLQALCTAFGQKIPVRALYGLTLAGVAFYFYWFSIEPNYHARTLVFTGVTVLMFTQYLVMCWREHTLRPSRALTVLIAVSLVAAAANVLRLVYYTFGQPQDTHFLEPSPANALIHATGLIFTVGGTLAFILAEVGKLQRDVQAMAERDELTQLLNRRGFAARAAAIVEASTQRGEQLALVMFDLDHFKALNDNHGHDTGDRLLVETARIIATHVRRDDLVARMGGEEFVVLMPNITTDEALAIAHRVRLALVRVTVDDAHGVPVFCSTSAGIALAEAGTATWESLYGRADRALYQAKAAGRNRCVVWSTVAQMQTKPPESVL